MISCHQDFTVNNNGICEPLSSHCDLKTVSWDLPLDKAGCEVLQMQDLTHVMTIERNDDFL